MIWLAVSWNLDVIESPLLDFMAFQKHSCNMTGEEETAYLLYLDALKVQNL